MDVSGQLHAPAALPPGKEHSGTHWIGGWVGPRAILDAVVKRKIPSPRRDSNPRTPIIQLVAERYTGNQLLTAVLAHLTITTGFDFRQVLGIFTTASRPALGPTQPPILWVPRALSLGVKRPGRKADHSPHLALRLRKSAAIPPLPHSLHTVVLC
jgi:hypothetical protein